MRCVLHRVRDYWDRNARLSKADLSVANHLIVSLISQSQLKICQQHRGLQLLATCTGVLATSPACIRWVATMFWNCPPPMVEGRGGHNYHISPPLCVVGMLKSTINVLFMSTRLLWQSFVRCFSHVTGRVPFLRVVRGGKETFRRNKGIWDLLCFISLTFFFYVLNLGHHRGSASFPNNHIFVFPGRDWLHACFMRYSGTIKYRSQKLEANKNGGIIFGHMSKSSKYLKSHRCRISRVALFAMFR